MARACQWAKMNQPPKFSTRAVNRCNVCGRSKAVYRDFKLCRMCLRQLALKGEVPGVTKASW
jgi:small subunit ribosomal protein S14